MDRKRIREYRIMAGPLNGNYGAVYIGRNPGLDRTNAIKLLHPHMRPKLIRDEAQKQMQVRSPYVVQIVDLWERPPAILMEYCPIGLGEHLVDRFRQTKGLLPFPEASELLLGILQGLNDAHKAGIVHGDIKPANIRFGEDTLPKLGDFGAARRLRESGPAIPGSTNWMAPELLLGERATKASDYFSFGILAYLVLSGRHPFYTDDPSCLTSEEDNIGSTTFKPKPLSSIRQDIPRVADLVMALLSRDPQERESAETSLKAALAAPPEPELEIAPPARPAEPISPEAPPPTPEELLELESQYDLARQLFFVHFRPMDAENALNVFLSNFRWERFQGLRVPKLADAWSLRAFINNSAGLFARAIEAATNGLKVDTDHINALHARGYAYIQTGEYEKAKEDLESAMKLSQEPGKREQIGKLLKTLRIRQPEPV